MRVYKGVESSTKTKVETPICRIINCDKNKQKKKQDPKKRNNRKHSIFIEVSDGKNLT